MVAADQADVDRIRDAHAIERRKTGRSENERPQTGKKWFLKKRGKNDKAPNWGKQQ